MKLTKKQEDLDLGLNMTPMIDIVFQLIIFFMVVSELATLDLERLTLPFANKTDTEKVAGVSTTVTINVTRKGEIKIKRTLYTDEQLRDFIKLEAELAGHESAGPPKISRLQVLIRADRDSKYEGVQRVLDACQRYGVYKTSVASTQETFTRDP